jgi:hypothetical protein
MWFFTMHLTTILIDPSAPHEPLDPLRSERLFRANTVNVIVVHRVCLQEIVAWMGWTPWKISYASNYFDKLHSLAIQLIKAGKAFVCHQVHCILKVLRAMLTLGYNNSESNLCHSAALVQLLQLAAACVPVWACHGLAG